MRDGLVSRLPGARRYTSAPTRALGPGRCTEEIVAKADNRPGVTLACEDCKRRNYQTQKNKQNDRDRIAMKKFCRWCGHHTQHRETR